MYKIITPVVTAFNENEKPDFEKNKNIIDFLIDGGVDGILVLGSSGEFTTLSYEDKLEFFKFYSEYTNNRVELYSGTNCSTIEKTIKLSNECIELGYKGAMVIGPYYYALDQEKIFIYYDTLAKSVKGNIYIYNFPDRSGHSISEKTLEKLLKENKNIKGLKDSVIEVIHTNKMCRVAEKYDFEVYSGYDDHFLYNISSGGSGCIAALSNIVPEIWSDLVENANSGNLERTLALSKLIHRLMELYEIDSNFSLLFKKLMIKRGVEIRDRAIFPFNQMSEGKFERGYNLLVSVLEDYSNL